MNITEYDWEAERRRRLNWKRRRCLIATLAEIAIWAALIAALSFVIHTTIRVGRDCIALDAGAPLEVYQ